MYSSPRDIIITLYKSGKSVFRLKDIALLTGITNFQSINKRVNHLVHKKQLIHLRKGIYALENFRIEEVASKIYAPSYLSIDYVLQKEGVIFQYDSTITSISYLSRTVEMKESSFQFRKIKNEILTNTNGVRITNNAIFIASAERAFLDYIYLNGNLYIDNMAILNKKKIKEILQI